jgi:hypothetical protein
MIWSLGYTRLTYDEQTERAIGQIYVSITTNDFHMVIYQIQQVVLYKSAGQYNVIWTGTGLPHFRFGSGTVPALLF